LQNAQVSEANAKGAKSKKAWSYCYKSAENYLGFTIPLQYS